MSVDDPDLVGSGVSDGTHPQRFVRGAVELIEVAVAEYFRGVLGANEMCEQFANPTHDYVIGARATTNDFPLPRILQIAVVARLREAHQLDDLIMVIQPIGELSSTMPLKMDFIVKHRRGMIVYFAHLALTGVNHA